MLKVKFHIFLSVVTNFFIVVRRNIEIKFDYSICQFVCQSAYTLLLSLRAC